MDFGADQMTKDEAARLLGWWLEAGVDTPIVETPRNWLKPSRLPEPSRQPGLAERLFSPSPAELPADYESFRHYLEKATGLPLDRAGGRRVLPHGLPGAKIMLLSDAPAREDASAGQPIGGDAWRLAVRMLAAIGLTPDDSYSASLACFHLPGGKLDEVELVRCGELARRHVALVKPERLLLFGDAPARSLLGQQLSSVRGRVHKIEGVRTVVSFHPRWLLQRPGDKMLAWRDLLLLMDDQ